MLNNYQKECIKRGFEKGYTSDVIGNILGINPATVRKFLSNDKKNSGLPPKIKVSKRITSGRVGLEIKKILMDDSKLSAEGVKKRMKEHEIDISATTIRKYLKDNHWVNRQSVWTAPISDLTRTKRLAFAKKWLRRGKCLLENVIWSDETTVKTNPNTRRESHWTPSSTPRTRQLKIHSGGKSQMFWGCISKYGVGPLITIDGTMDQNQYLEVLKNYFIPELRAAEGLFSGKWTLMQDNAPAHTARMIKEYLSKEGVTMLEWPPYSPDLNPIENIWNWIKKKVGICATVEEMEQKVLQAWNSITPEMCMAYCGHYERRLQAVKEADGYSTKY
jgi:predicted transcriptional regulator